MVFDSKFTLSDYVSQIISSTRVHARDIQRICLLPDLKTSVHLANALVSSRLDYCNSLFVSLTDFELRNCSWSKSQSAGLSPISLNSPTLSLNLKKLYWLPVRYRKQFKIGLITYKILNHGQPAYLSAKLFKTFLVICCMYMYRL